MLLVEILTLKNDYTKAKVWWDSHLTPFDVPLDLFTPRVLAQLCLWMSNHLGKPGRRVLVSADVWAKMNKNEYWQMVIEPELNRNLFARGVLGSVFGMKLITDKALIKSERFLPEGTFMVIDVDCKGAIAHILNQ